MSSEVFNLAIFLTLKDAASGGLDRFGAKLRSAGKEGKEFHKTFEQLRSDLNRDLAIGGVGIAGLSLMRKGIDSAATFEDAVLDLRKAFQENTQFSSFSTDQQEAQIKKLMALATEMGNQLQGDTTQYANLFSAMNRAGIDAEVTLSGAGRAAAYLANVTGAIRKGTAPQLGEDLGSFGKMFDLKGDEYMKVVQLFAALEDRFNIASGSLVESSKYFFSTAKGVMGMRGIEGAQETAKLFAFMKRYAGREGSEAGTSLDALISQYVGHQDKFQKLTKDTGIKLELFDSKGNFQGVENMFAQMEKMRKLNPAERGDWMTYLFREQGSRVAQAMTEQGVEGWKNITTEANKSVDVNTQIIQQMDTYNAKVEALTGSWENFKASAFTPLMGNAKSFLDTGSSIVNTLQKFSAENQGLMQTLGTIALYGSTALVAYSGIKTLATGFKLLSLANKFSKAEGLIPYLASVKEEAAKATSFVAGFTRPLDSAKTRVAGFARTADSAKSAAKEIANATSKAEKFKGTIQNLANSSVARIGGQIAAIAAAEFAITSFVQMVAEQNERTAQFLETAKKIREQYDRIAGLNLSYNAPGDYKGQKGEFDNFANNFVEAIKEGRTLETALHPERRTNWEYFSLPNPYFKGGEQTGKSESFSPAVAAQRWSAQGLTQRFSDPNILASAIASVLRGIPTKVNPDDPKSETKPTLNLGDIKLVLQALEKTTTKSNFQTALALAKEQVYGEKRSEKTTTIFGETKQFQTGVSQPTIPPFSAKSFQTGSLQNSIVPFLDASRKPNRFQLPDILGQRQPNLKPINPTVQGLFNSQPFSVKPTSLASLGLPDFSNLTTNTNTLSASFADLSNQANLQNQNAEMMNQQTQNIQTFGQSLTNLQQPIGNTQTEIGNLGTSAQRVPGPLNNIANSANNVAGSLNSVSERLANWQPPMPQIQTYTIGVPQGTSGSPVIGVQPPTKASGGTVLREGLVFIHKNEDIVPATVTQQYRQPQTFSNLMSLVQTFKKPQDIVPADVTRQYRQPSAGNNRSQSNLLSSLITNQNSTSNQLNSVNNLSNLIDRRTERSFGQSKNLALSPLSHVFKTSFSPEKRFLPTVMPSNSERVIGGIDKREGLTGLLVTGRDADRQRQARFEEVKNFASSSNSAAENVTINYSPKVTINGADKKAEVNFQAMLNEHAMEIDRIVARRMNNGRIRS